MTQPELQLLYFRSSGTQRLGLVAGDDILDVDAAAVALDLDLPIVSTPATDSSALLGDWAQALDELRLVRDSAAADRPDGVYLPLKELDIRAPVSPLKLLFAGANYPKHRAEATKWLKPSQPPGLAGTLPYIFTRLPDTIIGARDPVFKPNRYEQLDYEVELGAVIGTPGKHIPPEEALGHVAAFVVVNDLSLRDLQMRKDWPEMATDWLAGKSFDSSCPVGPYLVPSECIADYRSLRLRLSVNGDLRQDEFAGEMTFSLEEQISFVSSFLTLNAGDLISTGTPSGVAFGRPGTPWLQVGDVVEAEIDGLGRQRNEVRAEANDRSPALGGTQAIQGS